MSRNSFSWGLGENGVTTKKQTPEPWIVTAKHAVRTQILAPPPINPEETWRERRKAKLARKYVRPLRHK